MQRRVGFTLIELLVVIAIIAILAAILFPVFARARAKAQQNNCLSNIKQIALAALMYASDYDEKNVVWGRWDLAAVFPEPAGFDGSASGIGWPSLFQPYIKNTQIYRCPSQNDNRINYMINAQAGCVQYGYWNNADIRSPAERIMFVEGTLGGQNGCWTTSPGLVYSNAATHGYAQAAANAAAQIPPRQAPHNEGANCAYFDGHAKWEAQSRLVSTDATTMLMWLPTS